MSSREIPKCREDGCGADLTEISMQTETVKVGAPGNTVAAYGAGEFVEIPVRQHIQETCSAGHYHERIERVSRA